MAEIGIFRNPTSEEEKNFINISSAKRQDLLIFFLNKLAEKRQEYAKLFRPFDSYSARIEFEEKIRSTQAIASTSLKQEDFSNTINLEELDKYGNVDRFNLIEIEDIREDKLIDGMRTSVISGRSYKYKGKARGNNITIMAPLYEVENGVDEWVNKNFNNHSSLTSNLIKLRPHSTFIETESKTKSTSTSSKKEKEVK